MNIMNIIILGQMLFFKHECDDLKDYNATQKQIFSRGKILFPYALTPMS